MKKIDKMNELIKVNLNPSMVIKIVFNHTVEELEQFEKRFLSIVSDGEGQEYSDNCVDIPVNRNICYILTNKNYIPKLKQLLGLCDINYILLDASREFFDMKNLTDLLSTIKNHPEEVTKHFPNYVSELDRAKQIIKEVFENNFNSDDVLDKINADGINSLNDFHKNLLNIL